MLSCFSFPYNLFPYLCSALFNQSDMLCTHTHTHTHTNTHTHTHTHQYVYTTLLFRRSLPTVTWYELWFAHIHLSLSFSLSPFFYLLSLFSSIFSPLLRELWVNISSAHKPNIITFHHSHQFVVALFLVFCTFYHLSTSAHFDLHSALLYCLISFRHFGFVCPTSLNRFTWNRSISYKTRSALLFLPFFPFFRRFDCSKLLAHSYAQIFLVLLFWSNFNRPWLCNHRFQSCRHLFTFICFSFV